MNRIVVVGAGAMGTIIGALLSRADYDVELLDTYVAHVDALNTDGAQIVGELEETIAVKAITSIQLSGRYDLVISTTKQTTLQQSLQQIMPYLHRKSIVLTLQNGIPEDIAAQVVGASRVIGGGMEFSATFVAPGITRLASSPEIMGFTIGDPRGEITEQLILVQALLASIGYCHTTTNLRAARYTKLTDNCVCSGIATALGCQLGKVLDNDKAMQCIAELGRECSRVMQALKIDAATLFGFTPSPRNIDFNNNTERQKVIAYWRHGYAPYRQQTASMLQDIQNGRACEVDYINGKMLADASQLDIPMPYNQRVIQSIKALEAGTTSLERAWENLDYIYGGPS